MRAVRVRTGGSSAGLPGWHRKQVLYTDLLLVRIKTLCALARNNYFPIFMIVHWLAGLGPHSADFALWGE